MLSRSLAPKPHFGGRIATARWSFIDHFACNQAARALLTSPRVNRQLYISDHWPIYASLLAVPPIPPDVFIPTFNLDRCKELAPTISLCNQFSILANLPDGCDSDTVTNRLLDIINPNTAFSSLSNLPLIDTPVPVQHRRFYRETTKKAICKAKNAYRAWLASRDSILSTQETIQGKYNQYILAEATTSRLTKQNDRLRWRSHCTRIDNLLAGGCAKQAWNAAKRMACALGHSCRSSNPIRNEEGVLQFQPTSICDALRSHYMRLAEAEEGHSLDPTHRETMPQPPQHISPSSTLSMDLPFSLRELDHALGSMHPRKAPGDDGITTALMQAIAHDPKDHGTGDVNLDRPGALALLRVVLSTQTQLTHPIQLHGIDLPSVSQYRLTIFNGLVLGVAYYGLELIGGNSTLARRLQAPVNTDIRMIIKAPLFTPIAPMLTDCGTISLDAHAILARVRLTVKSITLKTPIRTLLLPATIPSHSSSWFWTKRSRSLIRFAHPNMSLFYFNIPIPIHISACSHPVANTLAPAPKIITTIPIFRFFLLDHCYLSLKAQICSFECICQHYDKLKLSHCPDDN
ncbi:hypothetical protein BASA83_004662 [Batrachochytrium salamandrivorans]|nr:hypothetical protein BASA83_004662 [Batrachochytrium salamandrivorans]